MALKNQKSPQTQTPKTTKKLKTLEAKTPAEPTNRPQGLTVVGIGASAGGLSALNSFFDALSPDTGMAFVVVMHLHPTYESHLAELLQQHTQMHENYGLDVSIQTNGVSTRFEDTLRILLFQAVREALFNVVKHAGTLQAAVTVEKENGNIQIVVGDGGVGFPPDSLDPKNGMGGLTHLRRRVDLMGCNLDVQSQPGKGTRVIIQVPAELASP